MSSHNTGGSSTNTASSVTNNSSEEAKKTPRVLFLGDGKVGKTCLIRYFLEGVFEEKYHPTVEDIYTRMFHVRGHAAAVEFMDTSGSYNFPAMREIWIRTASAFVLVFAQNDLNSFLQVQSLLKQCRQLRPNSDQIPLVVVCNKSDLPVTEIEFSDGSVESWIADVNLKSSQFLYASAKTGSGVLQVFEKLWTQNADHAVVTFEALPKSENRRLSATATLQGSQSPSKSNPTSPTVMQSGNTLLLPGHSYPHPQYLPHQSSSADNHPSKEDTATSPSKGLFRNRFGSQRKPHKSDKGKGEKGGKNVIRLDCVLS